MTNFNSIANAHNSIQIVLNKGAQILYDKYINIKLPQHLSMDINSTIIRNMNTNMLQHDSKNKLIVSKQPINTIYDSLEVGKLSSKVKPEVQTYTNPYKLGVSDQKNIKNGFQFANTNKIAIKPNFPIKFSCQKYDEIIQKQNQLRKEVINQGNIRKAVQNEIIRKKQNVIQYLKQLLSKRKKLQQNVDELTIKGISYTFDYNQNKIIELNTQKSPQKRILALKYQTIDFPRFKLKQAQISNVGGKRVGFYTNRIKKKQKISESQFNNNGQRQVSTIPFMTLQSGIKVVQPILNVIAHRRRSCQPNRHEYLDNNKNKTFKSYVASNFQKIQQNDPERNNQTIQRPTTTNFTSGKHTAQTGFTRRSILWRPQTTSSKHHRVNVNKNLIGQIVSNV